MDVSKIEGSLHHGRLFTGGGVFFLFMYLSISLILSATTVFMLIWVVASGSEMSGRMTGTFIASNIFLIGVDVIMGHAIIRNKKVKKEIKLWLEDAVQIKAYSETVDSERQRNISESVKIKVHFEVDGQKHAQVSSGKVSANNPEGYHKIWAHYADREIDILYSKKYDKVLILKGK